MAGLPRPRRSRSVGRSAAPGHTSVLRAGRKDGLQRWPAEWLGALPSLVAGRNVRLERPGALPSHHAGRAEHRAATPDLDARGGAVRVGGAPEGLLVCGPTVARPAALPAHGHRILGGCEIQGRAGVGGRGRGGVGCACRDSIGRAVRAAERKQTKTGDAHARNDAPAQAFCRPLRGSAAVNVVPCPFDRTSMLPP